MYSLKIVLLFLVRNLQYCASTNSYIHVFLHILLPFEFSFFWRGQQFFSKYALPFCTNTANVLILTYSPSSSMSNILRRGSSVVIRTSFGSYISSLCVLSLSNGKKICSFKNRAGSVQPVCGTGSIH